MHLNELKRKSTQELADLADSVGIEGASTQRRQELVFAILKAQGDRGRGELLADGVIEVLPDGFGFLRAADQNYQPGADDIYVSPSQIRRFALRTGDTVSGQIRPPKESERYFALLRVDAVNGEAPDARRHKALFDNLTPIYPDRRITLGTTPGARTIDMFAPLGFGQRALIIAPPRAGATALLEELARGIAANHPKAALMILLVDERPEDVTAMRRSLDRAAELVSSTFDEPPARHVQVAELVIEKAKRLAETGQDAIVLVDSLTRLAAAYGATLTPTGRAGAGGLDLGAVHKLKRFLGAARSLEEGGSLTLVATVGVGSGSRLDDLVAEELRATATSEIRLDARLADRRVFPAIDACASSTRRDELLTTAEERTAATALRRELADLTIEDAAALVAARIHAKGAS